jgi:hypothetical protein
MLPPRAPPKIRRLTPLGDVLRLYRMTGADIRMLRLFLLSVVFCLVTSQASQGITALDTSAVNKSVVFLFGADAAGKPTSQEATGFLVTVPSKTGRSGSYFLVTARHVVDPVWAGCPQTNPDRLLVRVNNKRFDPQSDAIGVSYIPVELVHNGAATWLKSNDDTIDVAVMKGPPELLSGDYDVIFMNFRNFGKPEEIAKLGVGSQIASAGLVPGLEGKKRNYPVFKFGKIASIPEEMPLVPCRKESQPREFRVWWLAVNLVPGNSGSPTPCCTDQQPGAVNPPQRHLRKAKVLRPPELQHPV